MAIVSRVVLESYHRFGAKHLGLVLLLIAYTLFGGWIFREIEGIPDTVKKIEEFKNATDRHSARIKSYISWRKQYLERLHEIDEFSDGNSASKYRLRDEALEWFEENLQIYDFKDFKPPELEYTPWTWWGSIFYVGTLATTIGYGNFGPNTQAGRVATMIYSLFGIPLTVTILNDWGNLLFRLMCFLWNGGARILNDIHCMKRNCSWCLPKVVKEQEQNPRMIHFENIPITVAVFMMIFWICASAGFYCFWEDWDYFTSLYFFFISLTTIGLGDVVPTRLDMAFATFLFLLMGLAVVAMSLNVIQAKLEVLYNDLIVSIDREYKSALGDPNREMGEEDEEAASDDGKEKVTAIESIKKNQTIQQQILFNLMGDHEKKLLTEKWEKKAKLRNRATQTALLQIDSFMQTDHQDEPTLWAKPKRKSKSNPSRTRLSLSSVDDGPSPFANNEHRKMYIYNCD